MKAYHISPIKNRNSILEKGLDTVDKKTGRIQYEHRLFFSIDKKDLGFDFVNFENVDCWEFEVKKSQIKKDEFSHSKNHFYIEERVDASKIKLVKSY
jgi:hypothetical protein